jgi:hypothetical protein
MKEHAKKIQELIDKLKRENKAQNFATLTPEEIDKKLQRANSPFLVGGSWNHTTLGGTVNYTVNLYNPGPTPTSLVHAHVWVGSGNIDPTIGTFLLNVDPRFPRLTQPTSYGLTMNVGASAQLGFALKVPTNVERTIYMVNCCVMQIDWFDVGQYLDRGCIIVAVT